MAAARQGARETRAPASELAAAHGREIRALGPAANPERTRRAYLELLKLALADLANGRTQSAYPRDEGGVFSRELTTEEQAERAAGIGWPLRGLTMIGLRRLDDLQACVEAVVADRVEGDLIEAGAWRGGASILIRATLDSLGDSERTVFVADSFAGLPKPDANAFPEDAGLDLSTHDFLAAPLEEVKGHFARFDCERGVTFVPGFFDQTLPELAGHRWSLVRLDGDTYESTWVALESLYPGLAAGGYLIVDDYGLIDQCRQAVDEFRRENAIEEPLEMVDWTCVRWRRESEPTMDSAPPVRRVRSVRSSRGVTRPATEQVPTDNEVALKAQVDFLKERLREVEAKLKTSRAELRELRAQTAPRSKRKRSASGGRKR
jgi:O-methyltransferase